MKEEGVPPSTYPHTLLQGQHQACLDQLHHCLVQKLPHLYLLSSPKGCADSEIDHWHLSPLSGGYIHLLVQATSTVTDTSHASNRLFTHFNLGKGSSASGVGLSDCAITPIHPGLFWTDMHFL